MRGWNVAIRTIPAYHPQANGKGERPHKSIRDRLRASCIGGLELDWDLVLPFAMEEVNSAHNRNLGMSPFQAYFGRLPRSGIDSQICFGFVDCTTTQWVTFVSSVHEEVATRNEIASVIQREIASASAPSPSFSAGQPVLLWFPTSSDKMHPLWRPGYTVLEAAGEGFYLIARRELNGSLTGQQRVPVRRLRAFDDSRSPDGGAGLDVKPGFSIVESIMGHTLDAAGDPTFRIRWKGAGPDHDDAQYDLADLVKNCGSTLKAYCVANSIPWSKVIKLRGEIGRRKAAIKAARA